MTATQVHDQNVLTAWNRSFLGKACDDDMRDELLAGANFSSYNAGNLVQARDYPWATTVWPVTLVVGGVFREFLGSENGRQVTVQYFRPGDVWGLVRVLNERPTFEQRAMYQALAPSIVLSIGRDRFLSCLQSSPRMSIGLARELSRLLVIRTRNFESSVFADTATRVAQHIEQLAVEDESGVPTVWLSQQEIADAVGTVREVVTRIIGQFRAQGVVRYSGRRLEVLDMDALIGAGTNT